MATSIERVDFIIERKGPITKHFQRFHESRSDRSSSDRKDVAWWASSFLAERIAYRFRRQTFCAGTHAMPRTLIPLIAVATLTSRNVAASEVAPQSNGSTTWWSARDSLVLLMTTWTMMA